MNVALVSVLYSFFAIWFEVVNDQVMNLKEEFKEAKTWVEEELHFNINKDVNLFETTIRVLGGLLSTYHLSAEKIFLDKAIDLAGEPASSTLMEIIKIMTK